MLIFFLVLLSPRGANIKNNFPKLNLSLTELFIEDIQQYSNKKKETEE